MDLCYFVSHNLGEYLVCSTLSETISTSYKITLNKLNPRSLKKRQRVGDKYMYLLKEYCKPTFIRVDFISQFTW